MLAFAVSRVLEMILRSHYREERHFLAACSRAVLIRGTATDLLVGCGSACWLRICLSPYEYENHGRGTVGAVLISMAHGSSAVILVSVWRTDPQWPYHGSVAVPRISGRTTD